MTILAFSLAAVFFLLWRGARGGMPRGVPRAHVVRIDEERPLGMDRRLARNAMVAGISQPERLGPASSFIEGSCQRLALERDPGNHFDSCAVKVIGTWLDETGVGRREQLGWVPHPISAEIASEEPLEASLRVLFRSAPGRSPGIRMDIWTTRKKRAK